MRTEAEIRRALDAARHWMTIIAELAKARDSILTDDEEAIFERGLQVEAALAWALGEDSAYIEAYIKSMQAYMESEAYMESVKLKFFAERGIQINPIGGVK
jgi:hypothetical protein